MNQANPNPLAGTDGHSALRRRAGFGRWDIIRTQDYNILEFLIIHCLCNTALKKTMHHPYIPCPPTTPSTQAGADRLLIQCLQSVHLEVHLGVHNENLQHLYRTPPPTTSWQVRTGANNIPPIVVYLLSTMKSCITCFYHATIP